MISLVAAAILQLSIEIKRDAYGVPDIVASSPREAFRMAGFACAQDRMWQLENSRRLARGKMSEVFGKSFVSGDKEVLQSFYTDEELQAQFDRLEPKVKEAFAAYAEGINIYIRGGKLPKGFAENGFSPEPWTVVDSMAIGVRMWQLFGRGGAGELRNWSLIQYAQTQPNLKGKTLELLDDLAWFNDSAAIPTVDPKDDPLAIGHEPFTKPTREVTAAHLASLPNASLFELLPGIRLASLERSRSVAEARNIAYKTGSYAMVVSPAKSATGTPILLSAPQMGFRNPSVVYEMAIKSPGFTAAGMAIPGLPGFAIGHTPTLAWGITSGVADTDDIVYTKMDGPAHYLAGEQRLPIEVIERTLKVKGEAEQKVVQIRTIYGPVVVKTGSGYLFSRRSSYWKREMESFEAFYDLVSAGLSADVTAAMKKATMNFNFFFALKSGEIGYRYLGLIPRRRPGFDPRLPIPGNAQADWNGFIPFEAMPRITNPKKGFLANWNNKPAAWWANSDTPVWGSIFRNESLLDTLDKPKLGVTDIEMAAWQIARKDYNFKAFRNALASLKSANLSPVASSARNLLLAWDGKNVDGSQGALIFARWLDALREEVFTATTGNFISADNFRQILQPSLILKAIEGKTKIDYRKTRSLAALASAALEKASARLAETSPLPLDWRYVANKIPVDGQSGIPYSDRGTYIQIIELGQTIRGRNIVSPGVSEEGVHSQDQVPLARAWMYKPMISLD